MSHVSSLLDILIWADIGYGLGSDWSPILHSKSPLNNPSKTNF